jgi:assimilatory nitrate reductase catalytic subunit
MTAPTRTTCPYCGVGCGVLASLHNGRAEIAGDGQHPANAGRLCSKGSALGDTLGLEDRLLHPAIGDRRVAWDEALSHVASELTRLIGEHGPEAIALYVSGQLLTEDYYVANKLVKGYIGTANIDTNSRLCMASAVAGHKRAFGADVVPCCYEDLELADLIVLVGSNTAWCHPVIYQRIVRTKEFRPEMKIVVVDPRRTPTCDLADLHLPVKAGSDVALFAGLLSFLHRNGYTDTRFVAEHTQNVSDTLATALETAGDLAEVAKTCGVDAGRLEEFYELFARTERVITAFSQGVNQSSAGTDKVNSIINCHLLTGRIGRPGSGPFSITGQPNAMGGREAGGMANMLAAHMELENAQHRDIVQRFWGSPRMASREGLKAVDLFDAIHDGRIKAVWIIATNPVVSLPDADHVRAALQCCELVVVSDCEARTDTLDLAHVRLPAAGWGEKDGTVTNSERCISRQRPFLPLPGEARPDWWAIGEVAKRMGFGAAFAFESPHEIFGEHARLSGAENGGTRAFDIGGLADLTREEYDALTPVQWPVPMRGHAGTKRMLNDGRFFHADGRARFVPTRAQAPRYALSEAFPLVLNTGRIRDQWHTMTRTGRASRLADHLPEPYVDMHAQDALLAGIREGELVRVSSRWGSAVARLRTSGEMPRGTVFMPIHWSDANASDARIGAVVNPVVDVLSGEPEFKHTPAQVEPLGVDWHGVLFTREPVEELDATWWTRVRGDGFVRYELGGRNVSPRSATQPSRQTWARELLGASSADADYLDYADAAGGVYRGAHVIDNRLVACVCLARTPQLPSRAWLESLFAKSKLDDTDRRSLLAGRPLNGGADVGPTVCSCFRVGRNTITAAIERHGLTTAAQVGERLKAGTNCGSCLPEIRQVLATLAVTNS